MKKRTIYEITAEIEKVQLKRDLELMRWSCSPVACMMIKADAEKELEKLNAQLDAFLKEFEYFLGAGC